ncbi:hypothetical protein M9Y10_043662 [Tritrichomonas musculus]|uniref:AGC family protein kinase n=1 Tax=Tritrichomonas musculus TaxID=1915356 RepID=A0ABR2K0Y8_9EUKA
MEFQAVGKKCSKLGFWNKCILRVVNDTITFSKPRSKKVDKTIVVTKDTRIDFENDKGKELITISDGSKKLKFTKRANILECLIALKSTKFFNSRLHLNDFNLMATIGQGSFGSVFLVQHQKSKEIFAMKCINKNHLYQTKSVRTILSERNLLEKLYNNNPFLIKMEFAFQNATDFFIGLEYAPGGDMRRLIDQNGYISPSDLRVYLAEIAICLNSLHQQKIIYRDLKPDNVLITANGHIKLTDFGLSKDISKFEATSTFCGTCSYLPPEIVSHKRYSYEVDWYQLGILAYELSFGKVPFEDENRKKKMDKIIGEDPVFPNDADPAVVDLIKCLLEKDPSQRMNFVSLKSHFFFDNFSFKDVEEKKIVPSFVPCLSHPADTRYFPQIDSGSTENEIATDDLNLFEGFSFISNEFTSCL